MTSSIIQVALEIIVDYTSLFLETLLFYMFISLFATKKYTGKVNILLFIIIYTCFVNAYGVLIIKGDEFWIVTIRQMGFIIIDVITCLTVFSLNDKKYRYIVYTGLFYILIAFIESLIFTICFIIFPQNNIFILLDEYTLFSTVVLIVSRLVELIVIMLAKLYFKSQLWNLEWNKLLLISILSVLFLKVVFQYFWSKANRDICLLLIILEIFIGLINIFVVYFVIKLQKATEKYIQIQAAIERRGNFILMMSALQDSVRQITHNIRDKLTVPLLLWINRGDYDKAREILFEYDKRLINFYPIKLTGNFDIDALLLIKSQEAKMHDIDFHIRGICKESINLPLDELGSLLGCAIDNAIEATRNINNEKIINIYITQNSYRLLIVVSNPHNGDIRTNRFGDIISTKESGGGNGINIMRKIAQKYDGDIDIEHSDSKFSLRITLMISTSYVKNTSEEESSLK